ncbi:MAG: CBS domain-containing protein [Myxococcota bacterium]|nr:CBS domain-containing protein [Myxococcales bacterium]
MHGLTHPEAVTLGPDATAWELADAMDAHGVGSIVIVDAARAPVGIVTDRDLVRRVVARGLDESKVRASEIMSRDLVTGDPHETSGELLERMRARGVRRIALVDDGRIAGVASFDDVLTGLATVLWNAADAVRVELRETARKTATRRRAEAREELVEDFRSYVSELESSARTRIEHDVRGFFDWLGGRRD